MWLRLSRTTARRREELDLSDEKDSKIPVSKMVEEVYRWKETAKLSLRLSEVMADLLTEVNHFCKENSLEISQGMDYLIGEVGDLFGAIKETQSLPIAELLRRPPTTLRQPFRTTDKETVYIYVHC